MSTAAKSIRTATALALALWAITAAGCNGFGTTDITLPGNTQNIPPQNSFRIVGQIGTPFVATIADTRSTWTIHGVVPLNIVIVNNAPPVRIRVNKLVNDKALLGIEIVKALSVEQLDATVDGFGLAVGNFGRAPAFPPAASPDVRFFVRGPSEQIFDALIEDDQNAEVVEATAPAMILFDSPASGRVDGIFTEVGFLGGFSIDLFYNNLLVQSVYTGTEATLKYQ